MTDHMFQVPSPTAVAYVLMNGDTPVEVYTDRDIADRDCWICIEGEKFSDNPEDFYVKALPLNTLSYARIDAA